MSDLYPFDGHFLDRNGLRLHYLDEGTGEPVVMVHGNPTWSLYYRNLVLALRDSHRCIVPDHIGCGLSDKPDDSKYDYRLKSRIDDLETLLDHLGLETGISLVVHDWGGMIGFGYATRHPERIRRLVVLNTAAFHLPAAKRLPWSLRLGRDTRLGAFLILRLNAFCRGAARSCVCRNPLPPVVKKAYLQPYDSSRNRIAVLRFVQDIPMRPGDPSYETVSEIQTRLEKLQRLPMLICWGGKDFVFDDDFLGEWMRRFPDAAVHRFPDAGHYVLEDAGNEIARLVQDALREG